MWSDGRTLMRVSPMTGPSQINLHVVPAFLILLFSTWGYASQILVWLHDERLGAHILADSVTVSPYTEPDLRACSGTVTWQTLARCLSMACPAMNLAHTPAAAFP